MAAVSMKVVIPMGLEFSALKLRRDPVTLDVEFDWAPIELICEESDIDIDVFREQDEDNVAGLIHAWYLEHLQRGGATDPVQEMLLAEVQAENAAGGQAGVISHAGGLQ
ncbi:MAG: hypothetical protein QE265_12400 [Rhodoferax sp.]|nr:hypothetical protein [Rhodoferax sp.]